MRQIFAVLVLLLAACATQPAVDLSRADLDGWLELRARDFTLVGDLPEAELRRYAEDLSILVAVAMSNKTWVIITGGILGVIAMRLVIGQLLVLVNRYPTLVDGAFVIIAWVGVKLVLEYLHAAGYVHWEVPKTLSLGLIVVIFAIALVWARIEGPVEADPLAEKAEEILGAEEENIAAIDGDVRKG